MEIWENFVSINSDDTADFEVLPAPAHFYRETQRPKSDKMLRHLSAESISLCAEKDVYPLPLTKDREGYHGDNHFEYWLSGLTDFVNLQEIARQQDVRIRSYLGFGCASGRVLRHFVAQTSDVALYGCDINLRHVRWISKYLGGRATVFQNTSIPYLPLPDASIDVIGAFSVFTHIECFDTMWLMELRRTLKPGGLAYVTIFSEETFRLMDKTWPVYKPVVGHPKFKKEFLLNGFETDRLVFRWHNNRSYASNVIYKNSYIENVWGSILKVEAIKRRFPRYQDAVILRKC